MTTELSKTTSLSDSILSTSSSEPTSPISLSSSSSSTLKSKFDISVIKELSNDKNCQFHFNNKNFIKINNQKLLNSNNIAYISGLINMAGSSNFNQQQQQQQQQKQNFIIISKNLNNNNCNDIQNLSIDNKLVIDKTNMSIMNDNYNKNNNIQQQNSNIEMMNAIEELRRENDRIINELGATQELLDLFEQYRDLVQEHMSICICNGKEKLWTRWNKYEQNYKHLLPQNKQNQSRIINGNHNDYNNNNNNQQKPIVINFQSNVKNNINNKLDNSSSSSSLKFKFSNDLDISLVNCNDGDKNNFSEKSLVRKFLDKIHPITMNGNLNNNNNNNNNIINTCKSSIKNSITIIPNGSNVIRKRTNLITHHHQMIKKLKCTTTNQFFQQQTSRNNNNLKNSSTTDQDVERLDKLNNALDQILMGKFDALTQLETYVGDKNNDNNNNNNNDVEDENDGDGDGNDNDDDEMYSSINNEVNDIDNEDNDDGEDDDDENSKTSVVNKTSIKINSQLQEQNNFDGESDQMSRESGGDSNDDNNDDNCNDEDDDDDEDDDVILLEDGTKNPPKTSTILSTVLESGLKPYSNYHSSSNNALNITNVQHAIANDNSFSKISTLKINPQNFIVHSKETTDVKHLISSPSLVTPLPKRPHLTSAERMDIINRLKRNESGARIARDYGITKQAVSAIKRRAQLMGDNFQNKYFGIGNNNQSNSRNQSPTPLINSHLNKISNYNLSSSTKGKSSSITMIPVLSSFNNSLVSRQLKQQKVNATILKQSTLLAHLPRSTSDLVLPINPAAIFKSQIAAAKQQQQSEILQKQLRSTSISKSENEEKLILSRLLQGNEKYTPNYVSSCKESDDQNDNVKLEDYNNDNDCLNMKIFKKVNNSNHQQQQKIINNNNKNLITKSLNNDDDNRQEIENKNFIDNNNNEIISIDDEENDDDDDDDDDDNDNDDIENDDNENEDNQDNDNDDDDDDEIHEEENDTNITNDDVLVNNNNNNIESMDEESINHHDEDDSND